MAYKMSSGKRGFGDIQFEDDVSVSDGAVIEEAPVNESNDSVNEIVDLAKTKKIPVLVDGCQGA